MLADMDLIRELKIASLCIVNCSCIYSNVKQLMYVAKWLAHWFNCLLFFVMKASVYTYYTQFCNGSCLEGCFAN